MIWMTFLMGVGVGAILGVLCLEMYNRTGEFKTKKRLPLDPHLF
ncbi:MAG: hypothetical protein ACLGPL_06695 [Acidobacteriota bacterium]